MAKGQGSGPEPAVRTVVIEPGIVLDEVTVYTLTELRNQQEANLIAYRRMRTELWQAVKASRPPGPPRDKPDQTPAIDAPDLSALERPQLPVFGEPEVVDRTATGEFLPVLTELRQEGGLRASDRTDGTHFWGARDYRGDDLTAFSVGATSHFELKPENIPESPTGRYHSAAPGDANGYIWGLHGEYHPVVHADDKRCDCYRIFRQTLWQNVNSQWYQLGESIKSETVIKLENETGDRTKGVHLSGWMPSPEFDFALVDRHVSVWAQVEIRFDVELEGDSTIDFGQIESGVVVRTAGWWARPA